MAFSFFKIQKHKNFEYTPRYYNERKERIEKLKKKYSENTSKQEYSENIKGQIKRHYQESRSSVQKTSRIRLYIIITILVLVLYYIIK